MPGLSSSTREAAGATAGAARSCAISRWAILSGVGDTATGSTLAPVSAVAVGAGAAAGFASAAPSLTSISATTAPSAISSPSLTLISFTTPANADGTSIVALSDSSVTRPWSFFTVSPTATRISITGTPS